MNSNRTARRTQTAKVRHLKKQARGEFDVRIVAATDVKALMANRHFTAAVNAGQKPKCLSCSHLFYTTKQLAAFMICSNTRGTKFGTIPICKNCYVLRREQLPLFVDEVLRKQLGVTVPWCPAGAAD